MVSLIASNVFAAYAAPTQTFSAKPAPRVSFTFDDGYTSALTQAAPTLAKYGYAGTEYIPTGCVGSVGTCASDPSSSYMTWEQVTQLQNQYGWEIGAHTVDHVLLASQDIQTGKILTKDEVIAQLTDSKNALAARGFNAVSFADPYGDWNASTLTEIAKLYANHRPFADRGYGAFPYNDYLLYVQQVQMGVSVAQVKSYIDIAKANNQWLILVFHDIQPTPNTDPDEYEYATSGLDEIAAYVKSQNIEVTTVGNGTAGGVNLLPNSSFDNGIADGWTTDAPATITADSGNNGSYPSPSKSVLMTGTAVNGQLFSPMITVDPAKAYFAKSFLNLAVSGTNGQVGYYIDEYDVNGAYLSSQNKVSEPSVFVENINFAYKPTSLAVAKIRLQIIVAGIGTKAYVDNVQFFAQDSVATSKPGDANGDNLVNIQDATLVSLNWAKTAATRAQGDVSGDGIVNIQDATLISLNWSK